MTDVISVEVAFALQERQQLVPLVLPAGSTLADAIEASRLQALFPDQPIAELKKGVWGTVRPEGHILEDGDRVEIYRPLVVEPREARRKRAARRTP